MPFTDAGLDDMLNGTAPSTRISFHTADPGTTGANEVSGTGRPATTWGSTAAGDGGTGRSRPGSQVSAPIPGGTSVTHWGVFSAATGGTFKYGGTLPATETFGSAGTIQLTPTLELDNG